MPSPEDISNQRERLQIHRRNLAHLLHQQAKCSSVLALRKPCRLTAQKDVPARILLVIVAPIPDLSSEVFHGTTRRYDLVGGATDDP